MKKKIKSRSGHKLFVSNLIKEVDTFVQNERDEVLGLPKLESIKCMLQEQRTKIKSLDSAVEELLEEDLLEKEIYDPGADLDRFIRFAQTCQSFP